MICDNSISLVKVPEPEIVTANRITPQRCGVLALELEGALEKLEAWSVPVPSQSRVWDAVSRLRQVAEAGHHGTTREELALTARAITLAVDVRNIAAALDPNLPGGVMGQELRHVLRGTLGHTTTSHQPSQVLSQYWFAVLLARSRLRPRVLGRSRRRSPDFRISVGSLDCGVEVKHPEARTSAIRALDSAADQIRAYGKPGVIAVDLSSCVEADSLIVGHITADRPAREHARPLAHEIFDELYDHAAQYSRSDKYTKVILMCAFTRLCSWHESDMSEPYLWIHVRTRPFPRNYGGALRHEAERIRHALHQGVKVFAVPGTVSLGNEYRAETEVPFR